MFKNGQENGSNLKSYVLYFKDGEEINRIVSYLKGCSILTIVLMHLVNLYMDCLPSIVRVASLFGGAGVHVFFLCSGYGLYRSYLKHKVSFKNFMIRRFKKIYMPYIFVIFISFLLPWMYSGDNRCMALLSHVLLFKMFMPEYESSFGTQFWFISTIIQLYVLFIPLCNIRKILKKNIYFESLTLTISIIWWIVVYRLDLSDIRIWSSFCLQYLWEFSLGICLAKYFDSDNVVKVSSISLYLIAVAGIGLQGAMGMATGGLKVFNDIPALLGYMSFFLILYKFSFIRTLGLAVSYISYELYLIHILVLSTVFHFMAPVTFVTQSIGGVIAIIISIFLAWLYNVLITKFFDKHVNF